MFGSPKATENREAIAASPQNLSVGGKGMSRIGRLPVAIPAGVTVEIAENNKVTVTGPKANSCKRTSSRNGNRKKKAKKSL